MKNKRLNIKLVLIICVLLKVNLSYTQNKILGKVTEESNAPLPFANITLYQSNTNKAIKATSGDDSGNYHFENIADGVYRIEVSAFGFRSQKSESFSLSKKNKTKKLNFILKQKSESLKKVVVKSPRTVIRQTAEKLIVDLEKSEMVNSNLQDVMKKVPGVIVVNGNISYAGRRDVTILINGKRTDYMDTASLLRDFPADDIAKIELIQQPGAEFDAEGTGPIINIILKKNVKPGTHGNLKSNVGYDNEFEYGTSASVSIYKNKLNWQVSAGHRKSAWREDLYIKRKVGDKIYYPSSVSPFHPRNFRLSTRLDYYINRKHSIGLSTRRIFLNSDRISSTDTRIVQGTSSDELLTDNRFERQRMIFNVNPYYLFEDKNNKINLDINYVDYNNDNINNLYQIAPSNIDYDNRRYFQKGNYQILAAKLDYKRTFSDKLTWMIGSKYSMVNTDSDLQSLYQDNSGVFKPDNDQSNRFLVDENIIAAYTKLAFASGKWSFSTGLRWEKSNTKGTSTNPSKERSRKISKLFPSASVSRKITKDIGVNLSYSYRINRPSYNSLNSFVYYYDPYTFEEGNPNLKPAFANTFKFSLTYDDKPFLSVSYNDTSDALFKIITQNDSTEETSRSTINLSQRKNWTFSAFAPLSFMKGLQGYTGIIVDYNLYKSENLQPNLDLSKWALTWYTNIEYQLPWKINSELSGYYRTGGLEGQIEHKWLADMSFAMGKKFMKDKLKVNLGVDKILDRTFQGSLKFDNIDASLISDWSRRNVYLQLTYNFGLNFTKNKKTRDPSKEEEDRIQNNN